MVQLHREPYTRSLEEAERRGETALLWDSYNTDNYCKIAIEGALRKDWDENRMYEIGIMGVVREYGLERVERLLANTIRKSGRDGCFSKENREWAKTVPVPAYMFRGYDMWREQILSSDPALLDLAVNTVRKERAWQAEHGKEKKPSIRVQLAVPKALAAAVGDTAKKYGREER